MKSLRQSGLVVAFVTAAAAIGVATWFTLPMQILCTPATAPGPTIGGSMLLYGCPKQTEQR